MYEVRLLDQAERDLERLDKPVGRRVVEKLRWLAAHIDEIDLEPLTGELAGLYKLRAGDYRIMYEPIATENVIIVHGIGHRREIYK